MKYKNKVVFVTGSTRGIGRGIAHAFAKEGARVAVNGTKADLCQSVVAEVNNLGGEGLAVPGDVSLTESVKSMFDQIIDRYKKIDILVNNAGVIYVADVIDTTDEQWDRTFSVNCRGVFLCTREAIRHMVKCKSGKIISISSNQGKTGFPKYAHYAASKFALIGFTHSLSRELAPFGINVNAVCPGVVDTDMMDGELEIWAKIENKSIEELRQRFLDDIPLQRYETPEDVAKLVLFLASEEASYITGQAYNISGGLEVH